MCVSGFNSCLPLKLKWKKSILSNAAGIKTNFTLHTGAHILAQQFLVLVYLEYAVKLLETQPKPIELKKATITQNGVVMPSCPLNVGFCSQYLQPLLFLHHLSYQELFHSLIQLVISLLHPLFHLNHSQNHRLHFHLLSHCHPQNHHWESVHHHL